MTADPDELTPVPDTAMATGEPRAETLDGLGRGGGEPLVTLADKKLRAWADTVEDGCIVRGLD
jgi:hypothetical protein